MAGKARKAGTYRAARRNRARGHVWESVKTKYLDHPRVRENARRVDTK